MPTTPYLSLSMVRVRLETMGFLTVTLVRANKLLYSDKEGLVKGEFEITENGIHEEKLLALERDFPVK